MYDGSHVCMLCVWCVFLCECCISYLLCVYVGVVVKAAAHAIIAAALLFCILLLYHMLMLC